MIESTELLWRGRGNAFTLHTGHSKKPILNVEPDATYSGCGGCIGPMAQFRT